MVRLSLAMIVKNEEAHLAHCLGSVKGLVDEMIVVDTGSTDGTLALAESMGALVGRFPWIDDFSAARNASLDRCSGDWVLVLDADEAIDRMDHSVIRAAIESPGTHGYSLWLRNYFRSGAFIGSTGVPERNNTRYTEGLQFSHHISRRGLRLFRRQDAPVFRGRVHELAEHYFEEKGLKTEDLEAVIHHYGKTDMERDRAKQEEYARVAKEEVATHPDDPMAHFNVVQEALLLEEWSTVLEAAQAYLHLKSSAPMLIYLGAAMACRALKRDEEGLRFLEPVLAKEPNHPAALCAMAESLAHLKRTEEAQQIFLRVIDAHSEFTRPFLKLAELLETTGDQTMARRVLEAGLDQNAKDLSLWTALVALSARMDPAAAAADAWDALQALPDGGKGIWHQLVAHALLARDAKAEAIIVLDRGLDAFPENHEILALKQAVLSSV